MGYRRREISLVKNREPKNRGSTGNRGSEPSGIASGNPRLPRHPRFSPGARPAKQKVGFPEKVDLLSAEASGRRRVNTGYNPEAPGLDCKRVVQTERFNCRSPTGRTSDDLSTVGAPSEMPFPALFSGVKYRDLPPRMWIYSMGLNAFIPVARTAG